MNELELQSPKDGHSQNTPSEYEAPAIESVLTPEELEREVLYAGTAVHQTFVIKCKHRRRHDTIYLRYLSSLKA